MRANILVTFHAIDRARERIPEWTALTDDEVRDRIEKIVRNGDRIAAQRGRGKLVVTQQYPDVVFACQVTCRRSFVDDGS